MPDENTVDKAEGAGLSWDDPNRRQPRCGENDGQETATQAPPGQQVPRPNVILDLDSREFFQALRQEAERYAAKVVNAHWCRKYLRLADSADALDAFLARSYVVVPPPPVPLVERIARMAHEVNRSYCRSLGSHNEPSWEDATPEQRESLRVGVARIMGNPNLTPEESHAGWMEFKVAKGWKYGHVKDFEAKTHPCLMPYDELPLEQRHKDFIFRGVVLSNLEFEKVTTASPE